MKNGCRLFFAFLTVTMLIVFAAPAGLAEENGEILCLPKNEVLVDGEVIFNDPAVQAILQSDPAYVLADTAKSNLANLKELSLTNDAYPVTDLSVLQLCTKLESVVISSDRLKSLEPLTKCPLLKSVTLEDCNTVDLEPLARCKALKSLKVRGGSDWDVTPVASMKYLTALSFSDIDDLNLSEACQAPLLASLTLNCCAVDFSALPAMKKLKTLSLSKEDLADAGMMIEGAAKTLTSVTLVDCIAGSDTGGAIGACTKITELTIDNVMGLSFPEECANKALAALTIGWSDLTGTAPLIRGAVMSLKSLSLTSCTADSDTGTVIGACTKLKDLAIDSVDGLSFPDGCANRTLATLTIGWTDLTGVAPLIQGATKSLKSLTLVHCTADSDVGAAIGACGLLTELSITDVDGLSFSEESKNKALKTLTITGSDMAGYAPLIGSAAKIITSITLTDCAADGDIGSAIGDCGLLKELGLTNVEGLRFPEGCKFKALKTLRISGSDMEGYAPLILGTAKILTSLSITDCTANSEVGGAIGACALLKEFGITNVEGLSFPEGCANKALKTLTVSGSDISGYAPLFEGAAKSLAFLSLTDCSAGVETGGGIGACTALEEFAVDNVKGLSFPEGCANTALTVLTVNGSDIGGYAPLFESAKTLVSLSLSDCKADREAGGGIGTCAMLADLAIDHVEGLSFPEGCANTALSTLTVQGCDMIGYTPLIAGASASLSTAAIMDSEMNEDVCSAIGACSRLGELKVQNVTGFEPSRVFGAKSLTALDISQLDGSYDFSGLSNLRNLATLKMSEVHGASFDGVGPLPKLSVLSLYAVETDNPFFISAQTKLTELSVGACRFDRFQDVMNSMQDKMTLKSISFWGMAFDDIRALWGAPYMQQLTLCDTNVTDIAPLTEMQSLKLQRIELYWNPIEDYNPLKDLSVETIILGNNLDDAIAENLRKALPQALVEQQDAPLDPLYDAGQFFHVGEVEKRWNRKDSTARANQWALEAMMAGN